MIVELHDGTFHEMTSGEAVRAHAECKIAQVMFVAGDQEGENWAKWCRLAVYLGQPVPKLTRLDFGTETTP